MDPITHTLTGAAISRAGYHRATPLATATLILAANAPDIDILTGFLGGDYATVAHRRGWTHGPIALALLPFAVMGLMLAYDRWVRRHRDPGAPPANAPALFLLALLGTATHPLLDWMNTYGIRLLMPFRREWYYGDALFIVDPWVWLTLGGAVYLAGVLGRRVRRGSALLAELGWIVLALLASLLILGFPLPLPAKVAWVVGLLAIGALRLLLARRVERAPRAAERLARRGLGGAVAYIALMVLASGAAEREVRRTLAASGFDAEQVMVAPEAANPFRNSILATTSSAFLRGSYHWLERPRVRVEGEAVPIEPRTPAVEAAAATPAARRFLTWSRFPVFQVTEVEDGYRVRISDLRFSGGRDGGLGGLTVRLGPDGEPRR
jgi:inner membrane protein